MNIPHKTLERNLLAAGHGCIVAVDEVGMGCLAGPVVVCAALFLPEFYRHRYRELEYLRDSKLLLPRQRECFAALLKTHRCIRHALAVVHPRAIDRLNVYQASRVGMRRAIAKLKIQNKISNIMVLVDGPHRIAGISHEQMPIIKGDRKIFAIACASIIAKVHRDAMMVRYAKRYPGYGLEVHKGYATAMHRKCLEELGPCPLHRTSFTLY